MERVSIRIIGKVTGVFFRAHVRDLARDLGIKGYVKNTPEDDLLVVAEGDKKALNKLVSFCKKGPESAVVEKIKIKNETFKNEFDNFITR